VIAPDVGGGFGIKNNFNPEEIAVTALALSLPLLTASPAQALTTHTITSPDGLINLTVTDQPGGALTYSVTAGTTSIFGDSPLGIATSTLDLTSGLSYSGETRAVISETYSLPAGTKPIQRT
jgi:alpha-glucosidase